MSRPRLLLDVDGVLADFIGALLEYYRTIQIRKEYDECTSWDIFEGDVTLRRDFERHLVENGGFCYRLRALPGAVEFVRTAQVDYDVVAVTAPMYVGSWCEERVAWLRDVVGIPDKNVVFAKRKELVEGDALFDDKFENVESWSSTWQSRKNVVAGLVDRPWNRDRPLTELSTVRTRSWQDVSDALEIAGYPKIG